MLLQRTNEAQAMEATMILIQKKLENESLFSWPLPP